MTPPTTAPTATPTALEAAASKATANLADAQAKYDELLNARNELQTELSTLEAEAGSKPDSLSVVDVLTRARAATRLGSDGPALRQAIRDVDRRIEHQSQQLNGYREQASYAAGVLTLASNAPSILPALATCAAGCDALAADWPRGAGQHPIVSDARELAKLARRLADALSAL